MAEQVEQLLVWDRAVRADAYDSVHQMRVTTRKIRSLLQASEGAFGISDDAWILDELRQLAACSAVARDAEVLAERYRAGLDELPAELVRGPVRQRLVDGAKKHYQSGLRRSLIAMRSQRYFRLLDALEGLVATEPPTPQPGEASAQLTIGSAYKRVHKAAKAARRPPTPRPGRGASPNPQGRQATSVHSGGDRRRKVSERAKTIQTLLGDHQDSVVSRDPSEPPSRGRPHRRRGHLYLRVALSTGGHLARRSREQLGAALKKLDRSVRKAD